MYNQDFCLRLCKDRLSLHTVPSVILHWSISVLVTNAILTVSRLNNLIKSLEIRTILRLLCYQTVPTSNVFSFLSYVGQTCLIQYNALLLWVLFLTQVLHNVKMFLYRCKTYLLGIALKIMMALLFSIFKLYTRKKSYLLLYNNI